MTSDEIRAAIKAGEAVCWSNDGYEIQQWTNGLHIVHLGNGYAIGLIRDVCGTLNGKEEHFYIKK